MVKNEFVGVVAEKINEVMLGMNPDAKKVSKKNTAIYVDCVLDALVDALAEGDKVQFSGFGTFDTVERASRTCRNPQTGEEMVVAAKKAPRFRASKGLKDLIAE